MTLFMAAETHTISTEIFFDGPSGTRDLAVATDTTTEYWKNNLRSLVEGTETLPVRMVRAEDAAFVAAKTTNVRTLVHLGGTGSESLWIHYQTE